MLADVYKDDKERGRAMGISFTGLALGLIGVYTDTASTNVHSETRSCSKEKKDVSAKLLSKAA